MIPPKPLTPQQENAKIDALLAKGRRIQDELNSQARQRELIEFDRARMLAWREYQKKRRDPAFRAACAQAHAKKVMAETKRKAEMAEGIPKKKRERRGGMS